MGTSFNSQSRKAERELRRVYEDRKHLEISRWLSFRREWQGQTCVEVESSMGSFVFLCNAPAVAAIEFKAHNEGPYIMCFRCACHSVRNRGATLVANWSGFNLE